MEGREKERGDRSPAARLCRGPQPSQGCTHARIAPMAAIRRLAVALLLTTSAAVCAQESALHQAVEKGDRELVERLLTERADPNARTPSGETPLHYAAFPHDAWFARRLIE